MFKMLEIRLIIFFWLMFYEVLTLLEDSEASFQVLKTHHTFLE